MAKPLKLVWLVLDAKDNHTITESFWLEQTFKIIESNCKPNS